MTEFINPIIAYIAGAGAFLVVFGSMAFMIYADHKWGKKEE